MAITKKELKELILTNTPLDFCRLHLFDQNIHIFEDKENSEVIGNYHEFKYLIANELNTSPNNVAIVGSGKFGFSMNPLKDIFKDFHRKSDIDVVIACPLKFEEIWMELRKCYYNNQIDVREIHAEDIFSKFLVVNDKMEYRTTYMINTVKLITEMKKKIRRSFRIKHNINYRIYSNWQDVENYHAFGVDILKNALNGPRGDKI